MFPKEVKSWSYLEGELIGRKDTIVINSSPDVSNKKNTEYNSCDMDQNETEVFMNHIYYESIKNFNFNYKQTKHEFLPNN